MTSMTVQEYVTKQPRFEWRRRILRAIIRIIGFGFLAKVQVDNVDNIPPEGATILMMSHISSIDPIVCMGAVTSRYVIPMTKIENTYNPFLGFMVKWWGAYTINRAEVDRKALQNSIELLKSGQLILIAPEGTRSPDGLKEPKDGLAFIATKANVTIVPTALSQAMDWKQRLGRFRRAKARVTFGRPFRLKTDGRSRIPRDELQQMTREAMYQLAMTQPDESLRGMYSDVENATTEYIEFINFSD